MSQQSKEDIDKVRLKSLDDLLQELDEVEEEEEKAEMVIEQLMEEDEREGEVGKEL